nr:RsfS/YbeB/iojap family protein [Pseudenhygromyxa sp. WMMC2535]
MPRPLALALEAAIERGARLPVILRLTEVAGYTDWALLLSARSDRQVRGVVEGVVEAIAKAPAAPEDSEEDEVELLGSDGLDHYLWSLLDYGDFLIHVFYHPVRRHYDLESMWSDAPRVELELPAELLDASDLDGLAAPDPMPDFRGDMNFGGFDDEFVDEDLDDEDFSDDDFGDDDFGDDDESLFEDEDEDEAGVVAPANERPRPTPAPASDDDLFEP